MDKFEIIFPKVIKGMETSESEQGAENKLLEIANRGIPVIAVDKPLSTENISSILIDNRESVYKAVKYLKDLGYRHICYIVGFPDNPNTTIRVNAFREFLLINSLLFEDGRVIYGDYSLIYGYQTVIQFPKDMKCSAFFCGDDLVAFGAITAFKQRGIQGPEDVAVVGFDDVPLAPFFDPPLTTINYPMRKMGALSFDLFLKMLTKKKKKVEHVLLNTAFIVRKSTDIHYAGSLPKGSHLLWRWSFT